MTTITNLLTNGDFEGSGWSGGSYDTAHAMYGAYSYKLTGSSGSPETLANMSGTIQMVSGHSYYVRWMVYHEGAPGSTGCYFGIWEPSFIEGQSLGPAGQWNAVSAVNTRPQSGSQGFRFDYNNNGAVGSIWIDGAVLVDLTADFGAGSEPSREWCDANIPFFIGSMSVTPGEHTLRRVEYIQGSSGQYIDMMFKGNGAKITLEADMQSLGGTQCIYGGRSQVSSTETAAFAAFYISDTSLRFDRLGTSKSITADALARQIIRVTPTSIVVDGSSTSLGSSTTVSGYTVYLSSVNTNGSADSRSAVRVFGFKVWHGDVPIRDYIPYTRDGTAGMLDVVSGHFFPSAATAFSAGPSLWNVTVQQTSGVTVQASDDLVLNGGSVTFTVTPDDGMKVSSFRVSGAAYTVPEEGGSVTITNVTSDLVAVAEAVTIAPPISGTSLIPTVQPNPVECGDAVLVTCQVKSVVSRYYALPASGWSGSGPYEMTVVVDDDIVPESECIVYADHTNTLAQRVAEYDAVLRADITQAGRIRFRALSSRPTDTIGVRVITGIFPTLRSVSVPASWWYGDGPWYANVDIGVQVQSATVAAVSGSTDEEAEGVTGSGIHVSDVVGQIVTLRAMLEKPTSTVVVGVMAI